MLQSNKSYLNIYIYNKKQKSLIPQFFQKNKKKYLLIASLRKLISKCLNYSYTAYSFARNS